MISTAMSETNSSMMEQSPSVADTTTSSEFGMHYNVFAGSNSTYNYPSTAASIASSDNEYQHDLTNSALTIPPSRPLSRTSTTSCMSVTAFKDGIEGKRVHRTGIPSYPYNLITTMNRYSRSNTGNTADSQSESSYSTDNDENVQRMSIPSGPPVSLNEKMKLLKTGQVQAKDVMNGTSGPSVGPPVTVEDFEKGTDADDEMNNDYAVFQNEAKRSL